MMRARKAGFRQECQLDVGSASIDDVSLVLAPGTDLSGTIKLTDGADVKTSGLRVMLEPREVGMMRATPGSLSSAGGNFTIKDVVPDYYIVRLFGLPDCCYVKSIRFGDAEITDNGVDLTAGVTPADFVITISPGAGQVAGSVQNDKQEPATSALVVLVPQGDRQQFQQYYRTTSTDQNGQYTLKGIVPGEYRLYAFDGLEAGAFMDPDVMKPFESKGERVSVKENGHESVQLKLIATEAH